MSQASCSQEAAVAKAARARELPQALAAHAAQCPACRDVAQAARWMRALAGPDCAQLSSRASDARPLPDAGLVWWRAHLEDEPAETKKIRTVLEWVQVALSAGVPLAAAGWVAWNWYPIETVAEQFLLNAWPQLAAVTYLASLAPAVLTVAALLLTYPLLVNE